MTIRDNLVDLDKNIGYVPSSVLSQRDGSDEGSEPMVSMRINHYLSIIIKCPLLSRAL